MLGKKSDLHGRKILDVDANLQGNLVFKDAVILNINGHFEGKLETKGDLSIGEHAVVKANIIGERITIAGDVAGDVTALVELTLKSKGKISGTVTTPLLTIEKGGFFNGSCRMGAQGAVSVNGNVFLTVDEVARYLSVEKNLVSEWAENGKLPGEREGVAWRFDKERVDEWIANGRIA